MSNRLHVISSLNGEAGSEKLVEDWVEGPCAESADLRGLNTLMLDFYDDPSFVRDLFEFVFPLEKSYTETIHSYGAYTRLHICGNTAKPRFIVGAGCEVVRDTPEENFNLLTQFARSN